jgi:tRNA (guanine37-N1)-methyltransferase
MWIGVVTIFPELFREFLATSLIGRARERGRLEVEVRNLRDFTDDPHRVVDDEPYGGGGGMVMTAPPWLRAVRALSAGRSPHRVLLSPQGRRLDDARVQDLAVRP